MATPSSTRAPGRALKDRMVAAKVFVATALTSDAFGALLTSTLARKACAYRGKSLSLGPAGLLPPRVVAALWWGLYESAEYRLVSRFLLPDLPVIELGAGIGAISVHVAGALSSGQHLACVEGNPDLVSTLASNLERYGGHLNLSVRNEVIGDGSGVPFDIASDHRYSRITTQSCNSPESTRRSTRLSAIGAEAPFRDGYQLVADVEGVGAAILMDDPTALRNCARVIIELHQSERQGAVITVEQLASLFRANGFSQVARDGNVFAFSK